MQGTSLSLWKEPSGGKKTQLDFRICLHPNCPFHVFKQLLSNITPFPPASGNPICIFFFYNFNGSHTMKGLSPSLFNYSTRCMNLGWLLNCWNEGIKINDWRSYLHYKYFSEPDPKSPDIGYKSLSADPNIQLPCLKLIVTASLLLWLEQLLCSFQFYNMIEFITENKIWVDS